MDEYIKECIKSNILCIVSLCRRHCEAGYTIPQMEKRDDIPFVLLQMAISLLLPENVLSSLNIQDAMKEIGQILTNEYVLTDNNKKYAHIVGWDDRDGMNKPINGYIWSLFMYTYRLNDNVQVEKNKFLWISILLPYIYLLNCSDGMDKEILRNLLMDYPITDRITPLEANLELFQNFGELSNLFKTTYGLNGAMPERADRDEILANAAAGCKVLINLLTE